MGDNLTPRQSIISLFLSAPGPSNVNCLFFSSFVFSKVKNGFSKRKKEEEEKQKQKCNVIIVYSN